MFAVTVINPDRSLLTQEELAFVVGDAFAKDATRLVALGLRVSAMITKACKVVRDGATPPTLRLESCSDTFRSRYYSYSERARRNSIVLSRRPVVTVTSVTEGDAVLTTDDYEIDSAAGVLYRLSGGNRTCWLWGTVVVSYTAGWAVVPYDLREMASKLATTIAAESGRDPSLASENIPGVYEATYRYGRPDDPLIPAEIVQGLDAGGYINHFIA